MNIYIDGVLTPPADAGSLDGIPAALQPVGPGVDGYVVTYDDATGDLELQPGGGGLPMATGAGEVPLSTGAGTTYVAANAATARAAIGVAGIPKSGTLAARPATPAAGDAYAVTSGVAVGDRYQCFVASVWSLASYDPLVGVAIPYLQWLLDETTGVYAQTGSATGGTLTVTGALAREAPGLLSDFAPRFTSSSGQYAEGASALTPPGAAFAVAVWVRPDTVPFDAALVVKTYASSGWASPYASAYLYLRSGRARCGVAISGAPFDLAPATGPVAVIGQWSHVAMVWDGVASPKLSLYLDGELVASSSPAGTDVDWNADGPWQISNSRAAEGIVGVVGGARAWGVALTAAQVREDFRRGAGTYRGQP